MIRRLYVDNFRSLVDFTWEPGEETLVLGYNGSGKSSALDALNFMRRWATDHIVGIDEIERWMLPRWGDPRKMTFECEIREDGQTFNYHLEFQWASSGNSPEATKESLTLDGRQVLERDGFRTVFEKEPGVPDVEYLVPEGRSAVAAVAALAMSRGIDLFVESLSRMVVVRPVPSAMSDVALGPSEDPSSDFKNFIGWYSHQTLSGSFTRAMSNQLNDIWEGFDYIELERTGRTGSIMKATFRPSSEKGQRFSLDFRELSDGERMLIVLYSLLAYQKSQPPTTIVIDEPDNCVSLREIQPWLLRMLNERPDGGQIILVSHNPETIQTMGPERVAYFSREDHLSPTRVSALPPDETGLPLPELLARGWLDA